jgi:hypothetical protein
VFTTYYRAGGSGNYMFTKSFGGRVFGGFRHNEYDQETDDRTDDISTAGVSLFYRPPTVKWLYMGVTYTYTNVNSTDDEKDFQEDRVLLDVTLTPAQDLQRYTRGLGRADDL